MTEQDLRPYQREACRAVWEGWRAEPRQLLVLATGTGKTYAAARIAAARRTEGRVLWLAHRTELLDQAARSLEAVGLSVQIERAGERAQRHPEASDVVCASVPSLHEGRLDTWAPHSFATIVCDEAHHAGGAKTWIAVLDRFRSDHLGRRTRVLGLTATPDRTDGVALGHVFDSAAYVYGLREAIRDGWLVPLAPPRTVACEDLDLRQVRVIAGDLAAGELEDQVSRDAVLHQIAAPLVELSGSRPTVVYTPGVDSARGLARVLAGYVGADSVASLDASTPPDRRAEILAAFGRGDLKALSNCMILTEGWDSPIAACIAVARPTKSRSLLAQCLGRGSRALPGTVDGHDTADERKAAIAASDKPDLLVIDFTGRERIDLVGPADVLAGVDLPDEARRAVDAIRERDPDKSLEDVLAEAEEIAAASEAGRDLERRRARVQAVVQYATHPIDLVDMGAHLEVVEAAAKAVREARKRACKGCAGTGYGLSGAACGYCKGKGRVKGADRYAQGPTERQVDFLARHGVRLPASSLRRQASAAIDLVQSRGLCSVKQARVLRRADLRTDLSKGEATAAIDALAAAGWQATPEIQRRWGT